VQKDYVWLLSEQLLELAEKSLDPTLTGQDLPGRRFIHHGQPVVEFCETGTLSIWHDRFTSRQIGRRDAPQLLLTTTFFVDVWRCWPVGNNIPPSLERIQDAVRMLHIDVWCLINGLQKGFSKIAGCEHIEYEDVTSLGPLGGMAGWRMPVTVGLPGTLPFSK
jgi:hypothetical protein